MNPYSFALILISFILILSFRNTSSVYADVSMQDSNLKAELMIDGLKSPTSMGFLDKDNLLVLEKDGTVQRIIENTILEPPVLNITSIINSTRERGLLGIAISDNSSSVEDEPEDHNTIYLYYTENIPNEIHNQWNTENFTTARVVNSLYAYNINAGQLVNPRLLFSIPFGNTDIGTEHIGGKISIGPDKRIYITGGDGYPCRSIEDCRLNINGGLLDYKTANAVNGTSATGIGGILAVPYDGISYMPSFIFGDDEPSNLYYAYGIRNSFGLDFDPLTGYLWDTENGPFFGDEINLVKPGFNSGWAKVQGIWPITNTHLLVKDLAVGYTFPKDDAPVKSNSLYDFDGKGEYSSPEFTWNKSAGPTALKFFDSNKLGKQYKDDIFVASYNKGRIYHFDLNSERNSLVTDSELKNNVAYSDRELKDFIFAKGFGPVTDLQVSPAGFLYVLTYDGKVWKITK